MLANLSVPWVILGHSERRALLNETNEDAQMSSLCNEPTHTCRTQSTCQQGEVSWNNVTEGLSMDADKQKNLSEGDIEKIEIPARGELNMCEADKNQEPCEGMLFESDEAARMFYDDYAARVGFITRVLSSRKSERDGTIISRGLGCRGDVENHKNESIMVKKKDKGRENCAAMILVKRETWELGCQEIYKGTQSSTSCFSFEETPLN